MSEEREGSADGPEAPPPPPPPPPPLPPPRPEPEDDGLTERPYLVWIDGLPVSKDFNFHTEYVAPCQAAYPQDFLQRKSFLCDRHDLWDAPVPAGAQPHLTWGVLAFRTLESAKECGMKAAAGPLIAESDSTLKQPPARVTVRRRIPAPQEEVDAMAEELRRQASINAGSLVRGAIAAAEQRWAAGELQLNALLAEEREPSPPPPPPPPPPPEAEADEAAAPSPAGPGAAGADDVDLEDRFFFQSSKRPTAPAAQQKQQEEDEAAAAPPPPPEEQQPPLPKEPQKQQEEEEEAPPPPPPEEQQPPLPEEAQRRLAPIVTRPQPAGKHARQHPQQASSPRLASPRVSSPRVASPRLTSPRGGGASKAAAAQQQAAHPPDDKKREKVRGMLTSALSLALKEAAGAGLEPSAAAAAAEAVEAALLKAHGTTSKEYAERARTLTYNLKVPANAELRGHVLKHEIAAHVFVHMTSEQLASKDLQRWRQNVRQESLRQAVLPPEIAAQISTAAAVQMRKEGRLGGRGANALLANHSSQAPEDQPLEEAAVPAAHALAPGSPYEAPAVSPVAGAAAAASSEQPLSPATALGSADVAAAAEGAGGGAAAGWQPPPPVRTMPTYRLATVSPAASGEHGGSPTAAATAGLWDDAELGLHPDEGAGEPGGTPDVHPPQQQQGAAEEEEEQQRSPTPDVEPLPAAGAGQQALPPPLQQPEEEEGREPTPDVDESADEAEEGGTPDAAAGAARQQQAAQPPPQQQREEAGEQRQLSSGGAGAAGTPSAQPQRSRGSREDERRRERDSAGKSGRGRDGKDPLSPKQRGRSRSRERRGSRHGSREKRRGSEGGREDRPERRAADHEDEGRDGRSRKDDGGSKRRSRVEEAEEKQRRKDARRAEEKSKGEAGRHGSKQRAEGSKRREEGGKRDSKKRDGGSRHDGKRREEVGKHASKTREGDSRHKRERRSSREGGQEGWQRQNERGSSPRKSRSHSKHRSPVRSPGKRGGERPQRKRSRSRSPRKRGSPDDYWQALSKRSRQEQAPPAQQQQQQGAGQPASGGADELDEFLEELEQGGSPQLPPQAAGGWEALLADEPEGSGHGTPDVDDGGEPGGTPDLQPPAGQQEQEQQLVPQLSGGWGGGGPAAAEPYPRPISAGWTYNDEQQQYVAGHQQQPHLHWGEQQGRPHGGHSQQPLRRYEGHGWQPGEQPLQQQQWQAGQQWQGGQHDWQQPGWQQQPQPPPQQGWQDHQLHEWQQLHGEWQPPDHGWWQGELDWPQGSDPSLLMTAAAVQWTNANSGLEPPRLPGRLPVQSTMDGSSLMPLLEGLGVKPGKVCWFLLTLREGERLAVAPALQAGKVGCCLVDLEGHDLLEAEAWKHGREHRGWMLHFTAPTEQVMYYAGVHRTDVETLGPGALLVLALPVWHGWFYHSAANHAQHDPLAAIRMLGSPLAHQLGPALVAHHRMHTSLPQFQQHREELVDQQLLVKARRAPPDQQALAKCCQNLRHAAKCYAVSLGNVAEMLLMPCRDGRHLQAAVWQPDMGPNRDRIVFDPWTLRIR